MASRSRPTLSFTKQRPLHTANILDTGVHMGLFSPSKKHQAAWNALVGSYTFFTLDTARKHLVLGQARDISEEQMRKTLEKIQEENGFVVFMNIIVYALGEQGIQPALGNEKWFWLKNPFIDSIGASEVLPALKAQLEKKYSVKIDIGE